MFIGKKPEVRPDELVTGEGSRVGNYKASERKDELNKNC